jgi:hypothetical protein
MEEGFAGALALAGWLERLISCAVEDVDADFVA